ncbi:hypothetical protein [Sagittula salina]|uniref:Uncharacterized protein n=1 Tax=Sagittula salina TaxID=2820268 RepID=A0A940MQC2_9RHOB|nr:hypothetical protein [Sagittula salina]MBP0483022.1 hypothetical protein [Sagittula salina]
MRDDGWRGTMTGCKAATRRPGERLRAIACDDGHMRVEEFDFVSQRHVPHHLWREGQDAVSLNVPFRYARPAGMDLMAQFTGMVSEARRDGWDRAPVTASSGAHVSVWRLPR